MLISMMHDDLVRDVILYNIKDAVTTDVNSENFLTKKSGVFQFILTTPF